MNQPAIAAVLAATLGVPHAAFGWWGGPAWGNSWNDWWNDFFGDAVFDFNLSMSASGRGHGRGWNRWYDHYGYYPYGGGPAFYGYPGYGYAYPHTYGIPALPAAQEGAR